MLWRFRTCGSETESHGLQELGRGDSNDLIFCNDFTSTLIYFSASLTKSKKHKFKLFKPIISHKNKLSLQFVNFREVAVYCFVQ